jgi:hypothetical protein
MTGPTASDIERRLNDLEDWSEVQKMNLSHIIFLGEDGEVEEKELVDDERGIWYCPSTDDLRLGPTKQELEEADDFMDAMTNDDVEVP